MNDFAGVRACQLGTSAIRLRSRFCFFQRRKGANNKMPTAEKERTIEQAKDWYSRSKGVVFTDYRGLTVKDMQTLRSNLKAKGGEIHVLKNTLFRVAAGDDAANLPYELHNGPTAIAFVFENESECTKAILDYAKVNKNLKVKGGFFSGKAFDAKQVQALSELPPRDVLIAQLIGTIVAPLTNLVGVIEALYADPIRVIGAVADKVAESSPIPTPAPAPAAAPAPASNVVEEAAPSGELLESADGHLRTVEEAADVTSASEVADPEGNLLESAGGELRTLEEAADITTSAEAELAPADQASETTE